MSSDLDLYRELYKENGHDAIFNPSLWYTYAPVTITDPYNQKTVTGIGLILQLLLMNLLPILPGPRGTMMALKSH